jgi:hypothetical protein
MDSNSERDPDWGFPLGSASSEALTADQSELIGRIAAGARVGGPGPLDSVVARDALRGLVRDGLEVGLSIESIADLAELRLSALKSLMDLEDL